MNKTLLIIVCDFLIISILSLADFSDYLSGKERGSGGNVGVPVQADILDSLETMLLVEKDVQAKLKASIEKAGGELQKESGVKNHLEKELNNLHKESVKLNKLLNSEKDELAINTLLLNKLEVALSEKNKINTELGEKFAREQEKAMTIEAKLREKSKRLELTHADLRTALNGIESLSSAVTESNVHTRKLENQLAVRMENLTQSQVTNSSLQKQLKALSFERDKLTNKTRFLEQHARDMEKEIGLKSEDLAKAREHSLLKELEKNKELADRERIMAVQEQQIETFKSRLLYYSNNELFQRFLDKRCEITLEVKGKGLISPVSYLKKMDVVLVKTQDRTGVLIYYKDSPLHWSNFKKSLETMSLGLLLKGQDSAIPLSSLCALEADPRILFLKLTDPLPASNVLFDIDTEIYRFDDALLIRGDEGKYGSFKLHLIHGSSNYFQVPSSLKTRLFGSFSPKPGDLVFSRNGKLLGVMVSKSEALRLDNLTCAETFRAGNLLDLAGHQETYQNWESRLDPGSFSLPEE
ncbi:MAG: hypothetical protein GY941_28595 [Planctomycetes bacterium]|nr:hypothetical protein [Planctomycetota bacterium]